jgi:hypothetical protein
MTSEDDGGDDRTDDRAADELTPYSPTAVRGVGCDEQVAGPGETGVTRGAFDGARRLDAEVAICWREPTAPLDYVRETRIPTSTWRDPPTVEGLAGGGRVVGYAVHAPPEATCVPPDATRKRRIFTLKAGDRCTDPDDPLPPDDPYAPPGAPAEAVDPRTVEPGVPGELTERVWGGPPGARKDGGEGG